MIDERLNEAKSIPIEDVAAGLGIDWLRRHGFEHVGYCPVCGGSEKRDSDRFSINTVKGVFQCRKCGVGGDQVKLVEFAKSCDFKAALSYLIGDTGLAITPEEKQRREALRAERQREQDTFAERARQRAIDRARRIWRYGKVSKGSPVEAYLKIRGVYPTEGLSWPRNLRFHPNLRYYKPVQRGPAELVMSGPAMLAVVSNYDGSEGTGVHCTWLDLDQPKGKASILWGDEFLPAKKVQGRMVRASIRLVTPPDAETLVMGEGIETTLSAYASNAVPGAAYWAGVTLGNMSGKMVREPGKKWSGEPDMSDPKGFVPPDWVKRLILIQDGDSSPTATKARLESCARRAMRLVPGLRAQIVHPGQGIDLNDLLLRQVTPHAT